MRFLADMGISPLIVNMLCCEGYDAVHLRDQGLHRLPDRDVLEKARLEERVLLTSDLDFGYLIAVSKALLPSVILFRLSNMTPDNVWKHMGTIIEHVGSDLVNGAFVVVSEYSFRVRHLPIGEDTE